MEILIPWLNVSFFTYHDFCAVLRDGALRGHISDIQAPFSYPRGKTLDLGLCELVYHT